MIDVENKKKISKAKKKRNKSKLILLSLDTSGYTDDWFNNEHESSQIGFVRCPVWHWNRTVIRH
jgi:hypothetical protein